MKTQKTTNPGLHLQKSNKRWKWMAGATAATAAGVTASQAGAITISLVGNYIAADFVGNHLNADLTGDGHPDLTIANAGTGCCYTAQVVLNGVQAYVLNIDTGPTWSFRMRLGSRRGTFFSAKSYGTTRGTPSLTGSIPLFFKDLHINSGAPTKGSLEVTVQPWEIDLNSFTYNTPVQGSTRLAAVPDEGSSLALLAMGAGGILALRRWRAAQGPS